MLLDPIFHRGLVLLPYPAVQLGQHIQTCWFLEEKLGGTDAVASPRIQKGPRSSD
jgi:hypothetical protein